MIDKAGTQVVSYTYDSWGQLISIDGELKDTVGKINSYLYRGYRYDSETGLYYLQSRYYNPVWERFINADSIVGIPGVLLSHNAYSYVINNPINQSDDEGLIAPAIVYTAYMYAMAIASSPDTQRDLQFISMDLARGDYLAAAIDLIGILVPTGGYGARLSKPVQKIIIKLRQVVNFESSYYRFTGRWASNWSSTKDFMWYHYEKHVVKNGINKTFAQYTNDAINFYQKYKKYGKGIKLKDGSYGVKIQVGKVGGIFTTRGGIVSFWYMND